MDKNVFSAEYLNWVCDLTALVPPPKIPYLSPPQVHDTGAKGDVDDVDEVESSAAKVALFLALDTIARAKDKDRLSQLMLYTRSWFRASPSVCRWALVQVRKAMESWRRAFDARWCPAHLLVGSNVLLPVSSVRDVESRRRLQLRTSTNMVWKPLPGLYRIQGGCNIVQCGIN